MQNRKMRRQIQEMTEDIKDKDVEIEELKFRINSESGAMIEVKKTIGDLEREIKQLKSDVTDKMDLVNEKVSLSCFIEKQHGLKISRFK